MYRNTNNTMYCVYDLAIAPITFDFMHFAVISEMARAANKFDYVHFVFTLNAERQWRMHTPKDKALSVEDKMYRLRNIIQPIAEMIPSYAGHSIYLDRIEAAKELAALIPQMIFPPQYHVNNPSSMFMLEQVMDVYRQCKDQELDVTPDCLVPSAVGKDKAFQWCKTNDVDVNKLVTITVRQWDVEPDRNTNIESWKRFAKNIQKDGWQPVFLVDTDQAMIHDAGSLKDMKIYWPGPINLELRLALYDLAAYNLSHNGGPAALNWFLPGSKYLQFLPVDAIPKVVESEGESGMERLLGVKKGETYDFAGQSKQYVWEKATATNIYREFNEFITKFPG